jgi:uncharacterized protein
MKAVPRLIPMFLSIKDLELRKVRFDKSFPPGEIDFSDTLVRQASPIEVIGDAELLPHTGGEVRIQGTFEVRMESECDRCLGHASYPLKAKFDLFYRPMSDVAVEDEAAIDEGEAEIGFYTGPGMELAEILREQVLLALPMQRVCREDCQGICPVCGANRNESNCACRLATSDDRWQALKNI